MNRIQGFTRYLPYVVSILLVLILLVLSFSAPNDPDMGWHLQNGAYILENLRLPTGDIYSWTMPGYPWVPHEWGTDVIMSALNNVGGLWALVVFFAIVTASTFYIVSGAVSTSRMTRLLVAIIGILISWTVIGVRPQMITLLGVAIVLYLIFNWRNQPKGKLLWWLPFLFFIWANLHGGFPIGFVLLVVFSGGEVVRHILSAGSKNKTLLEDRDFLSLIKWSSLAFVATFMNPNGWRVYEELYQTFIDRDVLNRILEWLPITLTSIASHNMALVVVLLFFLLIINRGKFDTTKLVLVVFVFFFSLSSWRHMPIFALTAMVLLAEQLNILFKKDLVQTLSTFLGITFIIIILVLSGSWQFFRISKVITEPDLYGAVYTYPYGAIQYLKENPSTHTRLFNEYGWGGISFGRCQNKKFLSMDVWLFGNTKILIFLMTLAMLQVLIEKLLYQPWRGGI